ncbi:hypothetical protein DFH09DRAFT_1074530 [Mycena vulgaris]|nr:hypothetical protein DFH09DRAFT_1074530 [Mycena vulgaris]
MFAPFDLPRGVLLLVTDQLASPADFVLHRAVVEHLKPSARLHPAKAEAADAPRPTPTHKGIVLAVSEDPARWRAIAAKSNLPLAAPSFLLLDVLTLGLRGALDALMRSLPPAADAADSKAETDADVNTQADAEANAGADTDTLVLLDDLAALEWLGVAPAHELTRWCRALGAACRKTNATLLIRQHVLPDAAGDAEGNLLLRALREQCAFHMEVLPLASGRSGAVSGQVALHAGPGTARSGVRLLARSAALQYKLMDGPGGAVFFERGTGAGVL